MEHFTFKAIVLFLLTIISFWLVRCGAVSVSDLNPDDFTKTLSGQGGVSCPATAPTFEANVVPIFSSRGCAATNCHGSTASGGLNLDPTNGAAANYLEVNGNGRVNTSSPRDSLILSKPAGAVSHGGGKIFSGIQDGDYITLFCWISDGAKNN